MHDLGLLFFILLFVQQFDRNIDRGFQIYLVTVFINNLNVEQLDIVESFCAAVAERLPDRLAKEAEAVLFLLLRDIGTGRLTLGSGSSIGLGRCRGIRLQWNGRMMEFRNGCISCDESTEKELQGLLASLQSQEESV